MTNGYADVNGLHMYYEVQGEGSPLVLLHGGIQSIVLGFSLGGAVAGITAPVLVVLGDHDFVTVEHGALMKRLTAAFLDQCSGQGGGAAGLIASDAGPRVTDDRSASRRARSAKRPR